MTLYEIKRRTEVTSPYFFTRKTLQFFGQTMRSFSVRKQENGKYLISAPMVDRFSGRNVGTTKRLFNPETNQLEYINN
jgi:hypothetical protein